MREAGDIADELRDEVLQTILAVRLNLTYAVAHEDRAEVQRLVSEAQDHLATEAGRVRDLIERLESLAGTQSDAVV
jgi:signal transduction histidine kinase